jgi:hypothetical protein
VRRQNSAVKAQPNNHGSRHQCGAEPSRFLLPGYKVHWGTPMSAWAYPNVLFCDVNFGVRCPGCPFGFLCGDYVKRWAILPWQIWKCDVLDPAHLMTSHELEMSSDVSELFSRCWCSNVKRCCSERVGASACVIRSNSVFCSELITV